MTLLLDFNMDHMYSIKSIDTYSPFARIYDGDEEWNIPFNIEFEHWNCCCWTHDFRIFTRRFQLRLLLLSIWIAQSISSEYQTQYFLSQWVDNLYSAKGVISAISHTWSSVDKYNNNNNAFFGQYNFFCCCPNQPFFDWLNEWRSDKGRTEEDELSECNNANENGNKLHQKFSFIEFQMSTHAYLVN